MLLELVLDGDETVALHAVAAIDDLTNDTQSALIDGCKEPTRSEVTSPLTFSRAINVSTPSSTPASAAAEPAFGR